MNPEVEEDDEFLADFGSSAPSYEEFSPEEALESFSDDELLAALKKRGLSTASSTPSVPTVVPQIGASKTLTVTIDGAQVTLQLPPLTAAEKAMTLEDYQEAIYRRAFGKEDSRCAACGSRAKVEDRSITGSMAATLSWMCYEFRRNGGQWIYMPEAPKFILAHAREYTILARWVINGIPLISRPRGQATKTTSKGYWRPEQSAFDLVEGKAQVPRYVYSYKDNVFGYSTAEDSIKDIVNNQFDLQAVLAGRFSAGGFTFTKTTRTRQKAP